MSRLTALVPGAVCAAALSRCWPDDLDGQVRCIDEGTRSLSLAYCCAPWSVASEDAALRAELGHHADPAAGSSRAPVGGPAAGAPPNPGSLPSYASKTGPDFDGDAVATGLARVPGAPPVLGLVSGPLTWGIRAGPGPALEDAVDAASDLASARVRALAECGVERVVVVESADAGRLPGADLVDEAHRPVLRAAEHLRIDVLLLVTSSCRSRFASLGYRLWAAPDGCADGLAFLPAAAFCSDRALAGCIEDGRVALVQASEAVTAPLGPGVDPGLLRQAAGLVRGGSQ